jgi:hypothetical protein
LEKLLTASPALEAALAYAERGWPVFPCKGKKPLTKRGFHDATRDVTAIEQAWRKNPSPNIGMATGDASGIWVLDVDGPAGEASLKALQDHHGTLPPTVAGLTGGGGRHLLFRYQGEPIRNTVSGLGEGLDVRATGGYIIVPPSIHPETGAEYQWDAKLHPDLADIADAPPWLIELVCGPRQKRARQSDGRTMGEGKAAAGSGSRYGDKALENECRNVAQATTGSRNARLNTAAFSLGQLVGGDVLKRGDVERSLFAAAAACGLLAEDGEAPVLATIKSGLERGLEQPRKRPEPEPRVRTVRQQTDAAALPERLDSPEAVLCAFNEKYAVVNEAGKIVVYRPKRDEQLDRDVIERIQFEDFRRMFMNRRIQAGVDKKGNPKLQDIGSLWLGHPDRRQHLGGVVMDPTGKAPADCWNLWRGFAVDPRSGDWSLMRDHIRDVICSGNQELFDYVMGWLARMVQHPDRPGEVALVLRGKKGTGKGTLGNWLDKLLGQHGVHITHAKHLVGNFNAHLRDAVFVFADEAFFAGDKQHEGVLKALITEPTLMIEAKYQNAVSVRNMTHILMASNSDWVIPASSDERRYCVMDVSEARMGDIPYFDAIHAQMEAGGLAAMLHDLLTYDLSSFDFRTVPQTEALADQKRHSLDSAHRWLLAVLHRRFVWRSRHGASVFTDWSEFVPTELLNRSYGQWCSDTRERWPMSREQLGVFLKGIYKPHRPQGFHPVYEIDVIDPQEKKAAHLQFRPYGYLIGPLDEAQAAFEKKTGITFDWGSESDAS